MRKYSTLQTLDRLEPRIVTFISDKDMWVLRDSKTHHALNVAFSKEGLDWTTNARGSLVCFENARLVRIVNVEKSLKNDQVVIDYVTIGSTDGNAPRPSNKVYRERFVPMNHSDSRAQIAEYVYVDKAYRLLSRLPMNNELEK